MIFNPEDASIDESELGEDIKVSDADLTLTPEEQEELRQEYNTAPKNLNNISLGAMVVAAALSAGLPSQASAQGIEKSETTVQPESVERRVVRHGSVEHPTEGKLSFSVYYKIIDKKNPTFGNNYGIVINGVEREAVSSLFMRNGGAVIEFLSMTGQVDKLTFPSTAEASKGVTAELRTADGQVVKVNK